eukprot:11969599-Alexandrium_andersonii.AAC.1
MTKSLRTVRLEPCAWQVVSGASCCVCRGWAASSKRRPSAKARETEGISVSSAFRSPQRRRASSRMYSCSDKMASRVRM